MADKVFFLYINTVSAELYNYQHEIGAKTDFRDHCRFWNCYSKFLPLQAVTFLTVTYLPQRQ